MADYTYPGANYPARDDGGVRIVSPPIQQDPGGGMYQQNPQYPITTGQGGGQQQAPGNYPPGLIAALTQPQYLNAPSTWNPSMVQSQNLDPNLMASLNPQSSIDQILQGFAPQAQSAQKNLMQTLADFGIGGGQAVTAEQQLQGQLAASLGPSLAGAIQNAQGNQLQGGEFNIQNALQAALSNQGSANQAGQFNANTANQFSSANTSEANQRQMALLNMILQDYFNQMNINAGTVGSGQSAGNQQAVNYGGTITTSDPFGQLLGALGAGAGLAHH